MRSTVGIPLLPAQAVAEGQGGEDVNQQILLLAQS